MTTSGQIDQLLEGLDGADFDDLNELDTGVGDEAHDGNMASDDLKLQGETPCECTSVFANHELKVLTVTQMIPSSHPLLPARPSPPWAS